MACYIIAGKADDPTFARLEYIAKQIEVACPGVYFRFEMKHPDSWKEFINSVIKKYDFDAYAPDFQGPLVWTHEGDLIGASSDFVQRICIEKFGMGNPPSVADPMFKAIAQDNLKQVQRERDRKANGPPFKERVEAAADRVQQAGLLTAPEFEDQRRIVLCGASIETWRAPAPPPAPLAPPAPEAEPAVEAPAAEAPEAAEAPAPSYAEATAPTEPTGGDTGGGGDAGHTPGWSSRQLREEFGDGRSAQVAAGLAVATAGAEESHLVLFHPRPLTSRHLVLVRRRDCREVVDGETKISDFKKLFDVPPGIESRRIEVPPNAFHAQSDQDLGEEDFMAALEAIVNLGAVATWMGLQGGTEYRHPIDTHIQVLPFPVMSASAGEQPNPLRYPLELHVERTLIDGGKVLPVFQKLQHTIVSIKEGVEHKNKIAGLAKAALAAFEAQRAVHPGSCLLAFSASWLLFMPLKQPPELGTPDYEAWLRIPPPPPCALVGIVIVEAIEKEYPETTGFVAAEGAPLVSNRALQENILENTDEYKVAVREARISTDIMVRPIDVLGVWALPRA
mmetsp:Transcript_71047/g.197355  ORF Transcript_71047/g.197355 Transcript_71047/m.197355 type:complete len:563 (+) Transcript_71047:64-1752(+)